MKAKRILFLFVIVTFLGACGKVDDLPNTELVGKWKLIETYVSPGGLSGEFVKVESDKIITFHNDGTVSCNGKLCDLSLEANNPTSGTYSTVTSTIKSDDCENWRNEAIFKQTGLILTISYFCFEGCAGKFIKL